MDTLFRAIAAALDAWDERGIQLYLSNIEKSKRSNKLSVKRHSCFCDHARAFMTQ